MKENHIVMKKFILFLYASILAIADADANAEDYTYSSMFETGKVWKYDTTLRYRDKDVNTFYTVTVIDGPDDEGRFTLCKSYNDEGLGDEYLIPDSYYTVKESDRVVYYCPETDVAWPLMDFNNQKGDKTQYTEGGWITESCGFFTVIDDELITVKGRTYRRLNVRQEGPNESLSWHEDDYWVEGVGSKNDRFLTLIAVPGSWHTPGGKTYWVWGEYLNSVYKDGECIFERTDFDIPASTSGIEERDYNSPTPISGIYDLQGRRLISAPEKGIYIKDGRKIVQK